MIDRLLCKFGFHKIVLPEPFERWHIVDRGIVVRCERCDKVGVNYGPGRGVMWLDHWPSYTALRDSQQDIQNRKKQFEAQQLEFMQALDSLRNAVQR